MTKHSTTHPTTGQIATREAKNRTYACAVWAQRTAEANRHEANALIAHDTDRIAEYTADLECTGPITLRHGAQEVQDFIDKCRAAITRNEARRDSGDSEWGVVGWCGRRDLASKLAARYEATGFRTAISMTRRGGE